MDFYTTLLKNLEDHTKRHTPHHKFSDIYAYALIPPGKLFRPLLAAKIYADLTSAEKTNEMLNNQKSALSLGCSALEVHHTYTLIHDDLPCMDDDDVRRGRPATHIEFGEWQALLAGDGLQAMSYRLISLINHPSVVQLMRIATWCLGTKGLIHGQALDLNISENKSFQEILLVHKLKTARLIQLACVFGFACANEQSLNFQQLKNSLKLGESIGMSFQLLDDLIDLYEDEKDHEAEINPWLHYFSETMQKTLYYIDESLNIIESYQLEETSDFIKEYYRNCLNKFEDVCKSEEINKFKELTAKLKSIN